jgi:hypothetical protein
MDLLEWRFSPGAFARGTSIRDCPAPCLRLGAVNALFLAEPTQSGCAKKHTPRISLTGLQH